MYLIENLKLKDIKEVYSDCFSCIKKIPSNYTLLLHPMHLKDIKTGIRNELNFMTKNYIKEFGGILMGYEAVKVLSSNGWLFGTNPFLHISIKADFYIFLPDIGSILKGKVVKKSPNHVGCLVHGIFNASSSIPHGVPRDQWCGSEVNEGDSLKMKITELNLTSLVPYLRGEILPDSISKLSVKSTQGRSNTHIVFNEDDSGISSLDKSLDDDYIPKKKKKKLGDDGAASLIEEEELDTEERKEAFFSSKKKKKKLGRDECGMISTIQKEKLDTEQLEEVKEEIVSSKKKKKKLGQNYCNETVSSVTKEKLNTKEQIEENEEMVSPKKKKTKKLDKNNGVISSIQKEKCNPEINEKSVPQKKKKKKIDERDEANLFTKEEELQSKVEWISSKKKHKIDEDKAKNLFVNTFKKRKRSVSESEEVSGIKSHKKKKK